MHLRSMHLPSYFECSPMVKWFVNNPPSTIFKCLVNNDIATLPLCPLMKSSSSMVSLHVHVYGKPPAPFMKSHLGTIKLHVVHSQFTIYFFGCWYIKCPLTKSLCLCSTAPAQLTFSLSHEFKVITVICKPIPMLPSSYLTINIHVVMLYIAPCGEFFQLIQMLQNFVLTIKPHVTKSVFVPPAFC